MTHIFYSKVSGGMIKVESTPVRCYTTNCNQLQKWLWYGDGTVGSAIWHAPLTCRTHCKHPKPKVEKVRDPNTGKFYERKEKD